jgi:hypothetical protein
LKIPRLCEDADIFLARKIHFDQRLDDVLPNSADAAAAVSVRMERIQTDALKNHNAISRRRNAGTRRREGHDANAKGGAFLQESPTGDIDRVRAHVSSVATAEKPARKCDVE